MSFVVVLGCDGAGKSTVLGEVIKNLEAGGVPVHTGHWRPTPLSSHSESNHTTNADDPHGQKVRGGLMSVVKLAWIWINWWTAWFQYLRQKSQNGYVFYDRYHGDLLVDPKRYRYGGSAWVANIWSRTLPQPDHLILLDADAEVLFARKQEISIEALQNNRDRYLKLVKQRNGHVLDVDRDVPEIIKEFLSLIR